MKKFTISKIFDLELEVVGFDLDGTLYDEFDFIKQAYLPISNYIAHKCECSTAKVYYYMLNMWLKFGSSKTDLFQDVFRQFGLIDIDLESIKWCVNEFRNVKINLQLSDRGRFILDALKEQTRNMFIVTDGNSLLQRKKIRSLGLSDWFLESNVYISGDYGAEYQKPSSLIIDKVSCIKEIDPDKIAYFGDRIIDAEFAKTAGFHFIHTKNMQFFS